MPGRAKRKHLLSTAIKFIFMNPSFYKELCMKATYIDIFHTDSIVSWSNVKSVYKTSLKYHILDFHFSWREFLKIVVSQIGYDTDPRDISSTFLNLASS